MSILSRAQVCYVFFQIMNFCINATQPVRDRLKLRQQIIQMETKVFAELFAKEGVELPENEPQPSQVLSPANGLFKPSIQSMADFFLLPHCQTQEIKPQIIEDDEGKY